jgi:xanthine dehydrogenase molybdenum-binding subunit
MSFKIERSPKAQQLHDSWRVLGREVVRREGYEKAAGTVLYTDDTYLPHMLYAKLLKSPYAHADIKSIDTSAAEALPGVIAVVTYKDVETLVTGNPAQGVTSHRAILNPTVYFVGDYVAMVAAEDEAIAEEAMALIKVEYQEKPFFITGEEAMAPGAPLMHPDKNDKD